MKSRTSVGLAIASLFAVTSTVTAQSSGTAGASATEEFKLEEIVVTARRRDESLQDVPQTVNAVTAETIEKLNLLKLEDIQSVVPGLTMTNNASGFGAAAGLRGVSWTAETQTDPSVEFYLDDAPVESNMALQSMFDVGQIEILRGPQGTLRGRASPSGAITISTRKANLHEFGGYALASGTNRNGSNVQGALNVPIISDVLAVRFAAAFDKNEADHVHSVFNSKDPESKTTGGRVNIAYQPIDSITANVTYQHLKKELDSYIQVAGAGSPGLTGGVVLDPTSPSGVRFPYPLNPVLAPGYNGPVIASGDRLSAMEQPGHLLQRSDIVTANIDWHFAGQRLSYVGGYRHQLLDTKVALDAGNLVTGGTEIYQFPTTNYYQRTQELRLASEERLAGLFDYTVGLYYGNTASPGTVVQPAAFLGGTFGSPLGAPVQGFYDPRYVLNTLISVGTDIIEKSVFASLTWHITDRTELTGGGRLISMKRDSNIGLALSPGLVAVPLVAFAPAPSCAAASLGSTYPGTCDLPLAGRPLPPVVRSSDDKPFVYNVQLSHHFTDELMAYANVGSSWRVGVSVLGVNNSPSPGIPADPALAQLLTLPNEKSTSYEIGLKSEFWDKRAQVNLAIYHQKFDGLIFRGTSAVNYSSNVGTGLSPASFQFVQSADAIVDGFDLDGSVLLTKHWNAALSFAYSDGHVDDQLVPCNDPSVTLATNANPNAPRVALCKSHAPVTAAPLWNSTLQSEYFMPILSSMDGYIRGLYTYYPKNSRQQGFKADAYGLLNLYLGVRDPGNAWEVSVFAKNVTNTNKTLTQLTSLGANQNLALTPYLGQPGYVATSSTSPREVGLMVRYAFGSR